MTNQYNSHDCDIENKLVSKNNFAVSTFYFANNAPLKCTAICR